MIGKAVKTKLKSLTKDGKSVFPISDYAKGLPAIYYIVRKIPKRVSGKNVSPDWEVIIITHVQTYAESWPLAEQIQKTLEDMGAAKEEVESIKFQSVRCTDIRDEYEFIINNYGQRLTFTVKTEPIT